MSEESQMNPDFLFHLRSLTRFIYYVTEEEDQFLLKLKNTLGKKYAERAWVFNAALGLVSLNGLIQDWGTRGHQESQTSRDIHDACIQVYKDDPRDEQNFYVFTDPDRWLRDPHVQRRFLNILAQLRNDDRTIKIVIFVGPRLYIPEKLQRYIEVVHDRGLTEEEIQDQLSGICTKLKMGDPAPGLSKHFKGLTSWEVNAAVAQSIIKTKKDKASKKRIDPRIVGEFKRQQLKKTDLLTYVDTSEHAATFDDVGGCEAFKDWANKAKACWTEEGQKFGLVPPKGMLAVGVWGCGKSLSVKAMGHAWRLPIVQLEMGKLRSSGVGESEANVYRALSLIEAVAPCVTGETLVTLADGSTEPIESLWQDNPEELEVMCWNERTLQVTATKVNAITRREAEAFAVTAANGFKVNATANHQHYVLRGGMPEWVRTDELSLGDMLAVPLKRYDGKTDCKRFHPNGMRAFERSDGTSELRRGGGGFRDSTVDRLPLTWTTDLGWLLGAIEGDGYIGVRSAIGLVNSSNELLTKFERVLSEQFGLAAVRRPTNADGKIPDLPGLSEGSEFKPCWDTKVTNQLAAEFLQNARGAILTAPPQVRAAFLAGWIDTDGCIGGAKVTLTVKGPKLRRERRQLARQLVQSLGVVPSKFSSRNFEVTGSRAAQLAHQIGEYLALKGAKAVAVESSDLGFDRGMGFACGQVLAAGRGVVPIAHLKANGISTSVMWRHENGCTPISERYMAKYANVFGAGDLSRLLDADCRWVEVTGVKSIGQQVVYDLVCEGDDTHSFFANGLVTHNCIVWVDEAEKSLAGNQSSARSDAGTTSRTIGIMSTWLQETNVPVCLAMTANSLATLPVEFVNRMDERFFFDLPSEDERIEILKIHLRKRAQDPAQFQLAELAEAANHMVGREIEQAIGAAMVESFHEGHDALDHKLLLEQLAQKPRIFKTMVDEMKDIIEWVGYDPDIDEGIRARFASKERSETFKQFRVAKTDA